MTQPASQSPPSLSQSILLAAMALQEASTRNMQAATALATSELNRLATEVDEMAAELAALKAPEPPTSTTE